MTDAILKKFSSLEGYVKVLASNESPKKTRSGPDLEKDLLVLREVIHYQNELQVMNNELTRGITKAEKEMSDRKMKYKSEKLLSTFSGMLKQLQLQHDTLLENKKRKVEEGILKQYEKTQSYHEMINDAQRRLTRIGTRNAELGEEKDKWVKQLIHYNEISSANAVKIDSGKEEYNAISERISELFANKDKKKKSKKKEKGEEGEENKDNNVSNVVDQVQQGEEGQKQVNAEVEEDKSEEEDESSDIKFIMHPHDLERMYTEEEDFRSRSYLFTERQKELSVLVTERGQSVTEAHDLFKLTNVQCKEKADMITDILQNSNNMERENTALHSRLMNIQKQLENNDPAVMNAAITDAQEDLTKLDKLLTAFQKKLKA